MIASYRTKINETLQDRRRLTGELLAIEEGAQALRQEVLDLEEMLDISRKAAALVQDDLATKLSGIVTKALTTVFEEPGEFVAEFVERRSVSECDLLLRQGGHDYDILRSRGGGMADVISTTLQMSFILLSGVGRVLIADEPCRHLSTEAQERFAQVMKHLAAEFGFTLIFVTHAQAFLDAADRVFAVSMVDGITKIKQEGV